MSEAYPMNTTAAPSPDRPASPREDRFSLLVIFVVTVIAYTPLVEGVIQLSARTTQALNAFLLVGFAFADALVTVLKTHRFYPFMNFHGLALFTLSCLALVLASVFALWPLAILGLCLNLAALLSFSFGRKGVTPFRPALVGLGIAVAMLVFVPALDGALRTVAAHFSSWLLAVTGIQADIVVRADPFQIVLVAEKGAGLFDVATECNGFGIILSSVVLTVILALRRGHRWFVVAGLPLAALLLGLLFNTVRIAAIVMTTLQTDMDYGLIHEGLGTTVYVFALAAVCAVVRWIPVPSKSPKTPTSPR
jgi:exosortase/archaeosortase family protein